MTQPHHTREPRVVVVVPTYDERRTLPGTLRRLLAAVPVADVLVVDDASPDGTGEYADEQAAASDRVHVLHRTSKDGLGRAYVAGFRWALDRGYDYVVEMDADGSHRPEQLPELLYAATSTGADLVIGSRWVRGGEVVNWPLRRQVLSRGASTYARLALGVPVRDVTAGFRVFPARTLRRLHLDSVQSQGYCFQVDLTWRVHRGGGRIVEVPVSFVERTAGESKMSRAIVVEALMNVTAWGAEYRAAQAVRGVRRVGQALRRS
ncbi:Dolichyl-phosphate beta-D-mannosyltransferase [Beutenbergia cavernae DSM 12333]|uniref:Dolichyl-phosphate beta-D-mannosyltransferase n=1 Tax=Beutenbergia cavernae (strain ATCC BAA-8 / DSM 12333 / CCUG 43141 / JCM 11478 / NBRC 16432 / NCIMB 13614 / HKI 0122) TaxID=471853 RepID=C5C6B4_BEUC1|nr:polyprenol monophosphomannose synthase [Beutenbergia cavernae]ACQ80320.1 Dolichyl-phosphate beta-D-mannosyltransferase [Beutenbergia cavernae DSM 12333]